MHNNAILIGHHNLGQIILSVTLYEYQLYIQWKSKNIYNIRDLIGKEQRTWFKIKSRQYSGICGGKKQTNKHKNITELHKRRMKMMIYAITFARTFLYRDKLKSYKMISTIENVSGNDYLQFLISKPQV